MKENGLIAYGYEGGLIPITREQAIAEVESLEAEMGFRLTDDYREFVIRTNGAEVPDQSRYIVLNSSRAKRLCMANHFYGVIDPVDRKSFLILRTNWEWFTGSQPLGMLPIGCDGFGNPFILQLEEDGRGMISFFNLDKDDFEGVLAESFSEFLELLGPEPES